MSPIKHKFSDELFGSNKYVTRESPIKIMKNIYNVI